MHTETHIGPDRPRYAHLCPLRPTMPLNGPKQGKLLVPEPGRRLDIWHLTGKWQFMGRGPGVEHR